MASAKTFIGQHRRVLLSLLGILFCWWALAGNVSAVSWTPGWSDVTKAMVVDDSGNSYITGWSWAGDRSVIATLKYGPDGQLLWEQRLANGMSSAGNAIAVDSGGNVYVAGKAYNPATSSDDYITVKYSSDGTMLWGRYYDGPGHGTDEARAIALDASGNVYVTGSSSGGSATANDYATVKYSPTGSQVWVSRYNGAQNGDDDAYAIAVTASGYAYVTGSSYRATCTVDCGGEDVNHVGKDYLTVKYSPSGKQLWASTFGYNWPGQQQGAAIALDSLGNAFITGPNWYWQSPDNGPRFTVIKYQSGNGQMLWSRDYNGTGNNWDEGAALTVDAAGNVYATGKSYGDTAAGNNAYDFVTIKYNAAGVQKWVSRYNGPGNGEDDATAIALDHEGNVLVAGRSWATGSYTDYATVKYQAGDGKELWVHRFGTAAGWDEPVAVRADAQNNVYVAGNSIGESTGSDYATLKCDPNGNQLWVQRYAGIETMSDIAAGIAVDGSGNVYVTGTSYRPNSAQDYATVAYDPDGKALWVARYDGAHHGTDNPAGIGTDSVGNVYVAGTSAISTSQWSYATIKYDATNGHRIWTRYMTMPGSSFQSARAMAVDTAGDVAITGLGLRSDFSGQLNLLTVKYDTDGMRLWYYSYNGTAKMYDYVNAIAMDRQGNVIVAGESENAAYDTDYLTLKYDATKALWARIYNGPAASVDEVQAVITDSVGNVYVTGNSDGAATQDVVTIKYSADGQRLWTNRYSVSGEFSTAKAIALDKQGNVYVTGETEYETGGTDYLTIKYNSSGKKLWAQHYNGTGNGDDSAKAIAVDDDGSVYVTGSSMGGTSSSDYATVKYSTDGVQQWAQRYNGPGNGWDGAVALVLDNLGNLYVAGTSYGGKASAYDYATVKYKTDGMQLWVRRYNGAIQ